MNGTLTDRFAYSTSYRMEEPTWNDTRSTIGGKKPTLLSNGRSKTCYAKGLLDQTCFFGGWNFQTCMAHTNMVKKTKVTGPLISTSAQGLVVEQAGLWCVDGRKVGRSRSEIYQNISKYEICLDLLEPKKWKWFPMDSLVDFTLGQ